MKYRCIHACMIGQRLVNKGEIIEADAARTGGGFERLLDRASFVPADAAPQKPADPAAEALRSRLDMLGIQYDPAATAAELSDRLVRATECGGGGTLPSGAEKGGGGEQADGGDGYYTDGEIDAMEPGALREILTEAGIPFAHNAGAEALRGKVKAAAAAARAAAAEVTE